MSTNYPFQPYKLVSLHPLDTQTNWLDFHLKYPQLCHEPKQLSGVYKKVARIYQPHEMIFDYGSGILGGGFIEKLFSFRNVPTFSNIPIAS